MVLKMVSGAVWVLLFGLGAAHAQSSRDFEAPRPAPPASFKGQSYVDGRGCVFLRAGFGGQTTWVPRVSRNRQQLCNSAPSGGRVEVSEAPAVRAAPAPALSPAPAPGTASRRPMDTVASITTPPRIRAVAPQQQLARPAPAFGAPVVRQAAPRIGATPDALLDTGAVRVPSVAGSRKIGCYVDAPVAERFAVRGGGTIVMCTRGDGNLANARAPRLPGGAAAVAPSGFVEGNNRAAPSSGRQLSVSTQNVGQPPKGYKFAWEDDRLNPRRGQGTQSGWYDQDGVWTREVPARLVEDAARDQRKRDERRLARPENTEGSGSPGTGVGPDVTETPRPSPPATERQLRKKKVQISSKSEPAATRGVKRYVQVGTFGQPANADGASARIANLGLPVARQKLSKGGKALQTIYAGPFASASEAQSALTAARRAGFPDAFLR